MNNKIKEILNNPSKSLSGAAELMLSIGAFVLLALIAGFCIKSLIVALSLVWGKSLVGKIITLSIMLFVVGGILKFGLGVIDTIKK